VARAVTEIHPEFFTDTGRWHHENVSAPTVRALLAELPPGTTVRDYFPEGREVTSAERGFCVSDMRSQSDAHALALRPKLEMRTGTPAYFKRRRELVDEEHTRRFSHAAVADGDGRQYNRDTGKKYDRDRVLDLWRSGHSGPEIEIELSMPKGSAMPLIQVARQHGELRAVKATSREWLDARAARTRAPAVRPRHYEPRAGASRDIVMTLSDEVFDRLDAAAKLHDVARATLVRFIIDAGTRNPALCARVVARARGV